MGTSAILLTLLLVTCSESAVEDFLLSYRNYGIQYGKKQLSGNRQTSDCDLLQDDAKKQVVVPMSAKLHRKINKSRRRILMVTELLAEALKTMGKGCPLEAIQRLLKEIQWEAYENTGECDRDCNEIEKNSGLQFTLHHFISVGQWVLNWIIAKFRDFLSALVTYGVFALMSYSAYDKLRKSRDRHVALFQVPHTHLIEDCCSEHYYLKINCPIWSLVAGLDSSHTKAQPEVSFLNKFKKSAISFVEGFLAQSKQTTVLSSTEVLVTPNGAQMIFKDINFYAPPNAVKTPVSITATLYRYQSLCLGGNICLYENCDDNVFGISLVLELHPSGQQFKNPVQITLRHSAGDRGWRLFLFRDKTHYGNRWEQIVESCADSGELEVNDCEYWPTTKTVSLTHFCRYCWVGAAESYAEKNIYCSLFAKPLSLRDSWKLTVILHDASDAVFEDILDKMKSRRRVLCLDGPHVLSIGSKGTVEVEFESDTWESSQPLKQRQVSDWWSTPYATEYDIDFQIDLQSDVTRVSHEEEVVIKVQYRRKKVVLAGWLPLSRTEDPVLMCDYCDDFGSRSGGGAMGKVIRHWFDEATLDFTCLHNN